MQIEKNATLMFLGPRTPNKLLTFKFGDPVFTSVEELENGNGLLLKGDIKIPVIIEEALENTEKSDGQLSLYEQIGGEKLIDKAVNIFYQKVTNDQSIRHFFYYTDIMEQARKQKSFLVSAFGGPHPYTGKDMRRAHEHLVKIGLDDSHFDAIIMHLRDTLRELKVPENFIASAIAIAESTRDDVLNR